MVATEVEELTTLPEGEGSPPAEAEPKEWAVFTHGQYNGNSQAYIIEADRFRQDGSKCLFESDGQPSGNRIVAVFPISGFLGAYVIGKGVRVVESSPPDLVGQASRDLTDEEFEALRKDEEAAAELYDTPAVTGDPALD